MLKKLNTILAEKWEEKLAITDHFLQNNPVIGWDSSGTGKRKGKQDYKCERNHAFG